MFNSEVFLFGFLPIVLLFYYILPNKWKNYWLFISSILFYACNNVSYVVLLFINILLNYSFALLIDIVGKRTKKVLLILDICFNLFLLLYFKYFNLFADIVKNIFDLEFTIGEVILPVGISFYIFQGLSYVIDVYKNNVGPQPSLLKLSLYISFFPQLVAGPIVRYNDMEPYIDNRKIILDDVVSGAKRFVIGLSKKVLLADTMALVVDNIWQLSSSDLTMPIAWVGCICYAFQIYFDFSGYSDMAIGLGKMLGFSLPENFRFPYIAKSITDFWRLWHITLSNWFRDYVYIPLGGNKKNHLFNLLVVFLLTGMWHGAGFNFIIFGIWHAFFNMLEKILKKFFPNNKKSLLIGIAGHIYTILVVLIGWVFFRTGSFYDAMTYLQAMFTNRVCDNPSFSVTWFLTKYNCFTLLLCILGSTPLPKKIYHKLKSLFPRNYYLFLENIGVLLLLIITILTLVTSNYRSFIYFQF